jgi:hypothetical protein
MHVIIGGEERVVEQVETFAEYTDTTGMSANDIFYGARANKLFDKVIQKEVDKLAISLSRGEPIELMPIVHPNPDEFTGGAIERAKQLEYYYADRIADSYESKRG